MRGRVRRLRGCALALLLLLLAPGPAAADIAYSIDITLADKEDKAVTEALQNASQLVALEGQAAALAPMRCGAAPTSDLPRLKAAMNALGYWRATIAYTLDTRVTPAKLAVTVTPGPLFHLAKAEFVLASGAPAPLPEKPADVGLAIGGSGAVGAGRRGQRAHRVGLCRAWPALRAGGGPQGHRRCRDGDDERALCRRSRPRGAVRRDDDRRAEARRRGLVTSRIAWREGAAYDERLVEKTRQDLVRSSLFSGVEIKHAEAPAPDGTVAMTIALIEGPPRSVGVGAGYNTNIGLGASAFWEHRNLFGNGENLRLSAGAAQLQQGVAANFRRPDFLMPKQDLLASAELLRPEDGRLQEPPLRKPISGSSG